MVNLVKRIWRKFRGLPEKEDKSELGQLKGRVSSIEDQFQEFSMTFRSSNTSLARFEDIEAQVEQLDETESEDDTLSAEDDVVELASDARTRMVALKIELDEQRAIRKQRMQIGWIK